jgi:hypothetical protein
MRSIRADFGRTHSGVIIWSADFSVGEQIRRILRIRDALSAEQSVNSEQFISKWGEDRLS